MKSSNRFLGLFAALATIISGQVLSAEPANTASSASTDSATAAPKKSSVRPHSHPRDAKGISVSEKRDSSASASQSASTEEGRVGEAAASTSKKVSPHSHPRDAKGM